MLIFSFDNKIAILYNIEIRQNFTMSVLVNRTDKIKQKLCEEEYVAIKIFK